MGLSDIDHLRDETRRELMRLRTSLVRQGDAQPLRRAAAAVGRLAHRLDRTLRVGIAGEFNTGKSSLCNRLVEIESLPTAAIANTNSPTRIHYAPDIDLALVAADGTRVPLMDVADASKHGFVRVDVGLPADRLQRVEFLDYPGLADPNFARTAQDLLKHHIDILIWCTPSTQAWKESERAIWSVLPDRLRSRTILTVTHRDLIFDPSDEAMLLYRLRGEVGDAVAAIVAVSTRADLGDGDAVDQMAGSVTGLWQEIERAYERLMLDRIEAAARKGSALATSGLA